MNNGRNIGNDVGTFNHPQLKDFCDKNTMDFLVSGCWSKLIVIGGTDTGKSTFIRLLADVISRNGEIGVVDLDIGQSHIGPPTTVGWGTLKGGFNEWANIRLKNFYFTGAISPAGNLLPVLVGSKIIVEKAETLCKKIVVDTTGLVSEPIGRVLKQNKIELLRPDLLVLFQNEKELEYIVSPFRYRADIKIINIKVPERVKLKTPENRSTYRKRLFNLYFSNSSILDFDLNGVGLEFTRDKIDILSPHAKGRVVSLRDRKGRDISLGIILFSDYRASKIFLKTPLRMKENVSTIVVGSVTLEV